MKLFSLSSEVKLHCGYSELQSKTGQAFSKMFYVTCKMGFFLDPWAIFTVFTLLNCFLTVKYIILNI